MTQLPSLLVIILSIVITVSVFDSSVVSAFSTSTSTSTSDANRILVRGRVEGRRAAIDRSRLRLQWGKNNNNNNKNRNHQEWAFTQVISDVDDTLKSSGGVNVGGIALGGIDVQYERGEVYPGVCQFMLELSTHGLPLTSTSTSWKPANVAILTARASEFKEWLELKPTSKLAMAFAKTGKAMGYGDDNDNDNDDENRGGWGIGPVLYGSVQEWILQDLKGQRKFHNFERLLYQDMTVPRLLQEEFVANQMKKVEEANNSFWFRLLLGGSSRPRRMSTPRLQYVYVGDTGELDQEAGYTMLREYPQWVKAVFLHVVSGESYEDENDIHNGNGPPIPPTRLVNGRPMIFFRTYVGAAAKARQYGLLGNAALARIIVVSKEALRDVNKMSSKWKDLERDIDYASTILKSSNFDKRKINLI